MERRSAHKGYRPTVCEVCHAPINQAKRGRPRFTCSDRCRQIKRRQDWHTYKARQEKKAWRRAEREVRKLEKRLGPGSLDVPIVPGDMTFTLRTRVLIRFARGEEVPLCEVCGKPYIIDTMRHYPTCKGACATIYGERQRALERGLEVYLGRYDPRVDVRRRLKLPIRACAHCGKPFCVDGGPSQMYCSKRCKSNAWYAKHPKRTCQVCGATFRGTAAFCPACCPDSQGRSTRPKRCAECGAVFYPVDRRHQTGQKYCSRRCKRRVANRRIQRAHHASQPPKVCRWCGKTFPRVYDQGQNNTSYCSESCRHAGILACQRASYQSDEGAAVGGVASVC